MFFSLLELPLNFININDKKIKKILKNDKENFTKKYLSFENSLKLFYSF